MSNDARRSEIQRLADRYQSIVQSQNDLKRRYRDSGYQLNQEIKAEFDRLIEAELSARADLDAALVGWTEPVYVKPIS